MPLLDPAPRPALTFAQAARILGVDPKAIGRLVRAGHLVAYVPPGHSLVDGKRGPKGCRILPADWDAYLASRRMVGIGEGVEAVGGPPIAPPNNHAPVTGSDGVKRIRMAGAGRPRRPAG